MTSRRSRRRVAFALIAALVVVGFAELAAGLAFYWLDGRRYAPRRLSIERQERATPETLDWALRRGRMPGNLARQVLHPFLGYVFDPAGDDRMGKVTRIDEQGFFADRRASPAPRGPVYRIGVFGGSVAFLFRFLGKEALIAELADVISDRPVVVDNFALGGYKQPQQAAALLWFLIHGERLDAVINLDGFNDLVLSLESYAASGTNPFYPRDWALRVQTQHGTEMMQRIGEILLLERRRSRLAERFDVPGLRWSATWNLVWRVGDRRLGAALADLRQGLSAAVDSPDRFLVMGPPFPAVQGAELYRAVSVFWRDSSLQMKRLCEANGIRYLHFLQPNQYVPGSKPIGLEESRQAYDPEKGHRTLVEEGYPFLQAAGAELLAAGVEFEDLTDAFQGVDEVLYTDDCCHFNRRGNEILARRIAAAFRRTPPHAAGPGG